MNVPQAAAGEVSKRPALAFFGELIVRFAPPGRQLLALATTLDIECGGAEANVAAALASLVHDARMIGRVPGNALGMLATRTLRIAGVDCAHVSSGEGRLASYFLSTGAGLRASDIIYDRGDSAFARCGPEDFEWDAALAGVDWLHLSGITPALGPRSAATALAAATEAKRRGIRISFDGNYRARLWEAWDSDPRAILGELVARADILFGNHRDISLLLGARFGGEGPDRRREAAEAAFAAFPGLSLIASTAREVEDVDRHRLAARIDGRSRFAQTEPLLLSGIVDRIGAGDAFAAGVLHGLLANEDDLDHAAATGLALAALKHSLPGDAALVCQADIDHLLSGELDIRR